MESLDKFLGEDELFFYHAELTDGAALIHEAVRYGWQGNLWHCRLTHGLIMEENPFALACERREPVRDSLWQLALGDMRVFLRLYHMRLDNPILMDFRHDSAMARSPAARRVTALAEGLARADTPERMLALLTEHYRSCGVGMLGMNDIFRVREEDGHAVLFPVENRRYVRLDELVGYELQKKQLLDNTLAFLQGCHANNVLLYGDAGTGKSTSVQAIAGEYAPQGLRVIELYKHQFGLIPDILNQLKGRNYRFILFLDDLSFEETETSYKHLKAVMEGGAEAAPENVRIYATSNRRHLIRETWSDRSDMQHDGDIHRSDTMEEKLSLAGRFGLQIYYPNPTFEEYHAIVRALAGRESALADLDEASLRAAAAMWQVRRGSRSGRSARQFIDDLMTRRAEESEGTHADA